MGLFDQLIVKSLPLVPKPIVARLSKPYIAVDSLEMAVATIRELNAKGLKATLDILGEFVTNFEQAEESLHGYKQALRAIIEYELDANISIKPTSFGLLLNRSRCEGLLAELVSDVAAAENFMRLDMEDSPCTSMTLELYERFREEYGHKVGVVLQSYMRRTLKDIATLTAKGPAHFRLCKGIYVEPENIAYQSYQEIRENFLTALKAMWDSGSFVGIATHDDYLVAGAEKIIAERGLRPDRYEFQMLLGVRETLRDEIHARGHNVRVYIPYGRDWYGYSVRRLKENPSLAGTMFRAIFFNK